mmetsp:Transcript_16275/g.35620  ORF Transcript_16275/g.35620 Transcript_16275/m.35620 type:complete len:261 (+) Transcript_16275:100-882(+)
MQRGTPLSSFERLFPRSSSSAGADEGEIPSVHELFAATLRDELTLQSFAEALASLHGIRMTPAAAHLMSSVDAGSGRLSFVQFQRALQEDADHAGQAGRPVAFKDHAAAIIADNSGLPKPAPRASAMKHSTDISADPFVRALHRTSRDHEKGEFQSNPVMRTNRVSAGHPLAAARAPSGSVEQESGVRELANTSTRLFVSGKLSSEDYIQQLEGMGVQVTPDGELHRLIVRVQVGDVSFAQLSRAVQREIGQANASDAKA